MESLFSTTLFKLGFDLTPVYNGHEVYAIPVGLEYQMILENFTQI